MAKLRTFSLHKLENVPDHIIQEMQTLAVELSLAIEGVTKGKSPNIVLAALNWAHCVILRDLVVNKREELEKAARITAFCLIEDMQTLIKIMEEEKK